MLGGWPRGERARTRSAAAGRLALGLLLAGAVAIVLWSDGGVAAEAGDTRVVGLSAGDNLVVYTGPALEVDALAALTPGLEAGWRWDAASQRYDTLMPPGGGAAAPIESGEALWLRTAEAGVWELPGAKLSPFATLVEGWNLVAWSGGEVTPALAFGEVAGRIGAVFAFDAPSGRFAGWAPGVADEVNTLRSIEPLSALWVRVTAGPPLAWDQRVGDTAEGWGGATEEAIARAVVLVDSGETAGSGFVVGARSILTAAHVAGEAEWLTVWLHDGSKVYARVTAIDAALDLALAVAPDLPPDIPALDWRSAPPPSMAEAVWVWGYPVEAQLLAAGFDRAPTVSTGIVSALRVRDGVRLLQVDAAVNQGNSGGPVVTAGGQVVGVVSGVLQAGGVDLEGLNFAVDLTAVREVLAAWLEAAAGSG